MTQPTRTLLEALIRLGKGMLDACDKWVKAQDLDAAPKVNAFLEKRAHNIQQPQSFS